MWRALRAFAVAGILMVGAGVPGRALAQPAKPAPAGRAAAVEKAKEHFQAGNRLFTVSRYREALEQFKNAFVAVEDPVFLYNIAQCHRLLGEYPEAIRFYRRYLEAAPSAPERARAERWIADLEGATPAPAPVAPPAPAPASAAAASAPPLAPAPGVEPPPMAAAPPIVDVLSTPPPEPSRPIYKRWWFWAGIGAVVVAGSVVAVAASKRGLTCPGGVQRCEQL